MLENVDPPRGVSAAEALNTRFGITRSLHLLPVKDKDRAKGKDKDDSSNYTRRGVGRRPTPTSRTGHLSKFKPDLLTNSPGTMRVEFMCCARRKQRMLPML